MLLGLQTWRCWGASTSLVSTKGQRSGVGGKMWKALHKPPIIQVKASRVLIATIDPAPPLTPLRHLRHLREPVWLIEELGFSSSVWPWVGEVGGGGERAKHTSQYYNGLWPSKAQAYPPRFYCLIFNFSHEGEFKFNLIFFFLEGDNEKILRNPGVGTHTAKWGAFTGGRPFQTQGLGLRVAGRVWRGPALLAGPWARFCTHLIIFALSRLPQV